MGNQSSTPTHPEGRSHGGVNPLDASSMSRISQHGSLTPTRKNKHDDDSGTAALSTTSANCDEGGTTTITHGASHRPSNQGTAAHEARTQQQRSSVTPQLSQQQRHGVAGGDSVISNNSVTTTMTGTMDARPKLRITEAKALFQQIFTPKPGELECIASGVMNEQQYCLLGEFLDRFLDEDMREKWIIDSVALSALGKDSWRFSNRNNDMDGGAGGGKSTRTKKIEMRHCVQQRRDITDELRARLMEVSGAVDAAGRSGAPDSLKTLLGRYRSQSAAGSTMASGGAGGALITGTTSRTSQNSQSVSAAWEEEENSNNSGLAHGVRSRSTMERGGLYVTRLRTTVTTSFDCFHLIASRIPTAIVSSFPDSIFPNSTPVLCDFKSTGTAAASSAAGTKREEAATGRGSDTKRDSSSHDVSYFVSMKERARLLHGIRQVPQADTQDSKNSNSMANPNTMGEEMIIGGKPGFARKGADGVTRGPDSKAVIASGADLFSGMRNLGLTLTAACSSMILFVLFHLADVINSRRHFREARLEAQERGVSLSDILGKEKATIEPYLGNPDTHLSNWKRYATTDEMSLTVLTQLLISRYRNEHRSKIEQVRKRHCNLFAYIEYCLPAEEQKDMDATRLLCGMVLKMMYLVGGGQRSIEADDRRVPDGARHSTDDLYVSRMLEVPILSRICWIACMLGMPMMASHGVLVQKRKETPLTFKEADECAGVLRILFQSVGALPWGDRCPSRFTEWLSLFPLYAVNTEGKRILMYLFNAHFSGVQRLHVTVQKDMALRSFAEELRKLRNGSKKIDFYDIKCYIINPSMTVGYMENRRRDAASSTVSARDKKKTDSVPAGHGGEARGMKVKLKMDVDRSTSYSYGYPSEEEAANWRERHSGTPSTPMQQLTPSKTAREADAQSDCSLLSSSNSTLLPADMDIDVFTCVSRQSQLYLRCAYDANVKRHKSTELTPFVSTEFYHSTKDIAKQRPDLAPTLLRRTSKLRPREAILVLRWTGAAVVTFQPGDTLAVLAEKLPKESRYFTGAQRRISETAEKPYVTTLTSAPSPRSTTVVPPTQPRRRSMVMIGSDAGPQSAAPLTAAADGTGNTTGGSSYPQHQHRLRVVSSPFGAGAAAEGGGRGGENGGHFMNAFTRNNSASNESLSSFESSFSMGSFFPTIHQNSSERVSNSRVGMRWTIQHIFTPRQFRSSGGAVGKNGTKVISARNGREVMLQVSCDETQLTEPLRVVTIGHQRNTMSAFTMLGDGSGVCWANPHLIHTVRDQDNQRNGNNVHCALKAATAAAAHVHASLPRSGPYGSGSSLLSSLSNTPRPSIDGGGGTGGGGAGSQGNLLCSTLDELHDIFYAVGFLLANAITNGVFLSIPLAPLVFSLFKRAVAFSDYSFSSFTWLEPCDGNLLCSAYVLNTAYEVLSMTDAEYLAYLKGIHLHTPEDFVFPIINSIGAVSRSTRRSSGVGGSVGSRGGGGKALVDGSGSDNERFGSLSLKSAVSSSLSFGVQLPIAIASTTQVSSTMHTYLEAIQNHNNANAMFGAHERNMSASTGTTYTWLSKAAKSNNNDTTIYGRIAENASSGSAMESVDKNGVSSAMCHSGSHSVDSCAPSTNQSGGEYLLQMDKAEAAQQLSTLPCREEFIALYLVNHIAWGSVKRNGSGDKVKSLWVSMAKGFMTSPLAKSPLMSHCCSRVIREVLCVPPK